MWPRVVETSTALTFLYCFGLASATLAGYKGLLSQAALADYGPFLLSGGVALVLLTTILRHGTAHWLWSRGAYDACVEYAAPRARTSILVGRTEAARNRIAAAESYIALDQPAKALGILEASTKPPSSRELQALLRLAEVSARFELGQHERATTLLASVRRRVSGRARQRLVAIEQAMSDGPAPKKEP